MIQSDKELSEYLDKTAADSEFLRRIRYFRNLDPTRLRELTKTELKRLQAQGNIISGELYIMKEADFDPALIHGNIFSDMCILGVFPGSISSAEASVDDIKYPKGIYSSFLANVFIAQNVSVIASTVHGIPGGDVSGNHTRFFGMGTEISPGLETGGRSISLFPDISYEPARYILEHPNDEEAAQSLKELIQQYRSEAEKIGSFSIICAGAVIHRCGELSNAFIGPGSVISGTLEIKNASIMSAPDNAVHIGPGVIIRDSVVKGGADIDSGAYVEKSAVLEYSGIERHAKVADSIVGPEAGIAEGEVTASFMGPFVGFHHQALLISAFWPDGRGNVACGANVGSNHTSRLPDQEIIPGEGMFFGLGSSVKFPADFRHAPYSIIATGALTLPQKMTFPFSLIMPPEEALPAVPPAYNHLLPGWCLYGNMYMCIRAGQKFKNRSRMAWEGDFLDVFRQTVMRDVWEAYKLLTGLEHRVMYLSGTLPGLGKNYSLSPDIEQGREAYRLILKYFSITGLIRHANEQGCNVGGLQPENIQNLGLDPFIMEMLRFLYSRDDGAGKDAGTVKTEYKGILSKIEGLTLASIQKDWNRGIKITDDYGQIHPEPKNDPVYHELKAANLRLRELADSVLK